MRKAKEAEGGLEAISYRSLNDIAYEKLVKALRDGRFVPGDVLRTRDLARALGVSSTPVREALSKLIAQNALEVEPRNRAAMVPQFTRELVEELYSLRMVLQRLAIEAAVENLTDAEIEKVKDINATLKKREHVRDSTYWDHSISFYFSIFEASRRPILYQILSDIWLRSSVVLGHLARKQPKNFSVAPERAAIVEALESRDATAACDAMERATVKVRDMVLEVMAKGEPAAA